MNIGESRIDAWFAKLAPPRGGVPADYKQEELLVVASPGVARAR